MVVDAARPPRVLGVCKKHSSFDRVSNVCSGWGMGKKAERRAMRAAAEVPWGLIARLVMQAVKALISLITHKGKK